MDFFLTACAKSWKSAVGEGTYRKVFGSELEFAAFEAAGKALAKEKTARK
ncbi:MAG: hypothetical protein JWM21_2280 [Acidobacteria bacterium]|nr:hypothetical protein [Acidobacteriota bacterium]